MVNYYTVLEIKATATRDEVKAAFRQLAKKYHPDLNPASGRWAHDRMQELLRAYEVLIDDAKRAVYDRTLSHLETLRAPSYREGLQRRGSDPASCCKLLFLDLLEGRGREGMALYEKLCASGRSFRLEDYMSVGDFLDCSFLLAEEYERQHRNQEALDLYGDIYARDQALGYFGHFRDEILLRLRRLVVAFCETHELLPRALHAFSRYLRDDLRRQERAFVYKKMAECFLNAGEEAMARLTFLAALQLHPKMGGTKKIRARLSMLRHHLG